MAATEFNHWNLLAESLPTILAEIVDETADAFVHSIREHIYMNGQVDTGYMASSGHKADGDDAQTKDILMDASYWVFQNYGTRFLPARPFVEPALETTRPIFEAKLGEFDERVKKVIT